MAERMIPVKLLDDITECPICTESYTDPRSLPCVHTFCLKCITEWSGDKLPEESVNCPLCRRSFIIPTYGIADLPKNMFIAKLLAIKGESLDDISTKLCGPCNAFHSTPSEKTYNAVAFCVDCQENLCETCRDGHSIEELFKTHRTVAVEEHLCFQATCPPAVCGKHPNEELQLYCLDCKEAMCKACSATQHKKHKSDGIAEIVSPFRKKFGKNISRLQRIGLQTYTLALKSVQDRRQKCVETLSVVEREVCERADELKATVERHKQQLLSELRELRMSKMKVIDNTIDEIIQDRTLLENFLKYSEELLMKGSDGEIASESANLTLTSTELKEICFKYSEESQPETVVTFTPSEKTSLHDSCFNLVGSLSDVALYNATRGVLLPARGRRKFLINGHTETKPAIADLHEFTTASSTNWHSTLQLSLEGDNNVTAVCSLDGQFVFVTRYGVKEIRVYDASELTLQCNIEASVSSGQLFGLAACSTNECLYVADTFYDTVYRMDLTSTDLSYATKWSVARGPYGLSVSSYSHNLLVACFHAQKVLEYCSNGSLIREIPDNNGFYHAIGLSAGKIVVSRVGPVHGVAVKSIDGEDIKTYGSTARGSGPGQMNEPSSLAVNSKGFIIVADEFNNRVLVLNPELTEARPLPLPRDVHLKFPIALCYEESRGHLYLGEYKKPYRLLLFSNIPDLSSLFKQ